jgi:hypothetical protein
MFGNILDELIRAIDLPSKGVYTEVIMKGLLRLVLSITILSSLAISQLPSSANCQMAYGRFAAIGCPFPCCNSQAPMPQCPLLKTSASRDLIASSVVTIENTLQPLHHVGLMTVAAPARFVTLAGSFFETVRLLFSGPPQPIRAPPTDAYLIAA